MTRLAITLAAGALIGGYGFFPALEVSSLAKAAESGVVSQAPLMRHPDFSKRLAIILVPKAIGASARVSIAHGDEEAYRARLRELGFGVVTIGPGTRFELEKELREVAPRIPPRGEVAVFVLGAAVSTDENVYLLPTDAAPDLDEHPEMLPAEGISLGDVFRRFMARGPQEFVGVIDECRNVARPNEPCPMKEFELYGASVIASYRRPIGSAGAPVGAMPSLQGALTDLLKVENTSFLQLYAAIRTRVDRSPIAVTSTGALSQTFKFYPQNLFVTLPHPCNQVNGRAEPDEVRRLALDSIIRACDDAMRTWTYVTRFAQNKEIAEEQRSFQKAVSGCADRNAATSYLNAYPTGRFRSIVTQQASVCNPPPPSAPPQPSGTVNELCVSALNDARTGWDTRPQYATAIQAVMSRGLSVVDCVRIVGAPTTPTTISSRAGWTIKVNLENFYVDPEGDDAFDNARQTFTTILKSRREYDGERAVIFIQVRQNATCVRPFQYFTDVLARTRTELVTRQDRGTANWENYFYESNGFRIGNTLKNFGVFDFVSTRRSDASSMFHVGARGPREMATGLRMEFDTILRTMTWPANGPFVGRC
jgi:hypothetical protein